MRRAPDDGTGGMQTCARGKGGAAMRRAADGARHGATGAQSG
ncbi:hypothetical protein BURMUCF2_A0970 [Burkholderia multivorans CF2]|nr:hypothetical protein BURMUCF2_A0970 [Burkholderia multivorans CF2]